MEKEKTGGNKVIVDLNLLNTLNESGCVACGKKFSLGDTVVCACGFWEGGSRFIHEREAIYDIASSSYYERSCFKELYRKID